MDLADINPERYVWRGSSLIAIHKIGTYGIVEYWSKRADNAPDKRRERLFGIYIDGKGACYSYASLDEALAGCIAHRHEGPNTRADMYFIRAIGAESDIELEG